MVLTPVAPGNPVDGCGGAGGVYIEVGLDNGDGLGLAGDGVLQPGEVDDWSMLCNGATGATGP